MSNRLIQECQYKYERGVVMHLVPLNLSPGTYCTGAKCVRGHSALASYSGVCNRKERLVTTLPDILFQTFAHALNFHRFLGK